MLACIERYNKLPKTGKPTKEEWTVLSAIVMDVSGTLQVVSFGTGTKCMGANALSPEGSILHDAHAEVMARRGFLIFLMEEIRLWNQRGNSNIFSGMQDGRMIFYAHVRFCFVTTAVPCGDAAIIPMDDTECENVKRKRRKLITEQEAQDEVCEEARAKRARTGVDGSHDIHRTGAKCLPLSQVKDLHQPGVGYHSTGQVRTKPGRGAPTASVSCSDKFARWAAVGLQGALLSMLIQQPVCFCYLIVAGGTPFSEATLSRAINERVNTSENVRFIQSSISSPADKSEERHRPAPCSITWNISTNQAQVCVEGKRLGATKSKAGQAALVISKKLLFNRFVALIKELKQLPQELVSKNISALRPRLSYRDMKQMSEKYQKSWRTVKDQCFKVWTVKPAGLDTFHAEVP